MTDTAPRFDDIIALVEAVELADILVHEERARRVAWPEGASIPDPAMSMASSLDRNQLRYRFRMTFVDEVAEFVADFESVYVVPNAESLTVDQALQNEFARRVAFMAVYPFLRASIYGSAARIGSNRPILGLVKQDEFEAGEELSPEAVQALFFDNRSDLAPI